MSRDASAVDLVAAARAAGVGDERLLKAISSTPRAGYVPGGYLTVACRDEPIPIGHGQVTTQPSLSAWMIEGLRLADADRVLEIGTGLGYQTALLARLASSVVSIERWPDLAGQARWNLARHGIRNVQVLAGDGSRGRPDRAPYDAVLVSAAFPGSARRWQPSSGPAAAWCSQSGPAAMSRSCCSSVPRPACSAGRCSPWPDSSGCTGTTGSSPGPDRAPAVLRPASEVGEGGAAAGHDIDAQRARAFGSFMTSAPPSSVQPASPHPHSGGRTWCVRWRPVPGGSGSRREAFAGGRRNGRSGAGGCAGVEGLASGEAERDQQ